MKYTIEQWKEKIRKDKEKESLNMSYLIAEMYKSLITLRNGGYWTQEELNEWMLKN
jgi:hypothetical protein